MAINKVQFGENTLMDITDTTATANDVANGKTFYGANGVRTVGTASGSSSTKYIDASDNTQWDSQNEQPTQTVLQDIGTHEYQAIVVENLPAGSGISLGYVCRLTLKLDAGDVHLRQYVRFEEGDEEENEPTALETWNIGNIDEETPTTYLFLTSSNEIMKDFEVNGNSIVSNGTANIVTNTAYNATSNKLATMNDIPSVSDRLKIYARSGYNLNTCYDAGVYLVAQGTNIPSGSNYGSLLVMPYRKADGNTTPDFGTQIFMPNGDDNTHPNSFYYRTSLANAWNSWQELETTTNKVTSISSSSTDAQYPSAKCVYDIIGDIETLLGGI